MKQEHFETGRMWWRIIGILFPGIILGLALVVIVHGKPAGKTGQAKDSVNSGIQNNRSYTASFLIN